jgi:hypothetical protein
MDDAVSTVVTALVLGGTAGVTAAASAMVTDAYQGLKQLVVGRLRVGGVQDERAVSLVEQVGSDTDGRERLRAELAAAQVDEATVEAAERLLELLNGKGSKYQVILHDNKGVVVGDHSTQHNTFN